MTNENIICVGTYHKTGTVWMRRVFRQSARKLDIPHRDINRPRVAGRLDLSNRAMFFNWNCDWSKRIWDLPHARIFRLVRDPRDVLISGASYHKTAGEHERFVHVPVEEFGGLTLQQKLQTAETPTEALLIEMSHFSFSGRMSSMANWPLGPAPERTVKYETLIADVDTTHFREVLSFMGFSEAEQDVSAKIFYDNSLFGGLRDGSGQKRRSGHVNSGKPAQWKAKMPKEVGEIFEARYGQLLRSLGYEDDANWTEQLS